MEFVIFCLDGTHNYVLLHVKMDLENTIRVSS